jgi:hypothetical protein
MPASPTYWFTAERENIMKQIIVGVDPHKLSATIEG